MAVALAVTFSVLIIAVLIISGGLQIYFNFQTQQKNLTDNLTLVADEAASTVNNFIQEKISILTMAAGLSDLTATSRGEQEIRLNKLLGLEPAFRQLLLFNSEKEELLRVSRASKLLSVQLVEYDGNELFSKTNRGENYISSSVYIDNTTSEPMVIMAVPITDIFGDFKGTLIAETKLKFMWDVVAEIKIGNNGLAYVVDKEGTLIAFSDVSRILKGENLKYLSEVEEFAGGNEVIHKNEAALARGIQGNYVVTNHAHLVSPDWAVVVELPFTEAYSTVIYTMGLSALAIILVAFLAVVISNYLSRRITKPLITLTEAAKGIERGELGKKIEIKSRDEIGELTAAFNEMAARLSAYTGELENKVTERTSELKRKLEELAKSNAEFAKAKKAMLNLLEDARTLEEELRKEKASVEIRIQERTQELSYERTKLNEVAQHMTTGAILLDINGRVSFVNAAAINFLSLGETNSVIEVFAQRFSSIPVKEYIGKALKGESTNISEAENLGKFFSIFFVSLKSEMKIFGALIWLNDITNKKLLERAKDQFLAIASHEMRTPLAIIRGNAELLLQPIKPKVAAEKAKKFIEVIYRNSTRLLEILHDFIDVIQIEGKYTKFIPKRFDLVKLTKEIIADLENLASRKKLYLKLEEAGSPFPMVVADANKARQIIINILNNALHYTEKGGITVSFKLAKEGNKNFLKLSVTDTGIGISSENQSVIFQKFTAIKETFLHSKEYGSGLGLYISKLLLEAMGGKIMLEKSVPNVGSTFSMLFPIGV